MRNLVLAELVDGVQFEIEVLVAGKDILDRLALQGSLLVLVGIAGELNGIAECIQVDQIVGLLVPDHVENHRFGQGGIPDRDLDLIQEPAVSKPGDVPVDHRVADPGGLGADAVKDALLALRILLGGVESVGGDGGHVGLS